ATFALTGGSLELDALVPNSASVKFRGGSSPFLAQFQASSNGSCFPGIACTGLQLETDLHTAPGGTFSTLNPIVWTADINATNTNVVAVHYYYTVSITGSPTAKAVTTAGNGFATC